MAEAKATQNHTTENHVKTDVSKEPQNDYLLVVNKKIRTLNKKLQKAAQIEKKISEGGKINEEQQGLLSSKPNTEKQLKDFEKIKKAMLSVHQADEEKQKSSAQQQQQRETEAKIDATRALVHLIHFAAVFDQSTPEGSNTQRKFFAEQEQKRASGINVKVNNESDINVIISLANAISKRQSGVNSVDHALKFALASQELFSGVSYAFLREQVAELASSALFSPQVPVEVHQEQQPVEEVQPAPQTEQPDHIQQEEHQEQQEVPEQTPTQEGQQTDNQEGFQEKGNQRKGGNFRGRGGRRGRGGFHHNKEHRDNKEPRDNNREHKENREHREHREHKEHRENRGRGGQRGGNRPRGNRGGQGNQNHSQPAQQ